MFLQPCQIVFLATLSISPHQVSIAYIHVCFHAGSFRLAKVKQVLQSAPQCQKQDPARARNAFFLNTGFGKINHVHQIFSKNKLNVSLINNSYFFSSFKVKINMLYILYDEHGLTFVIDMENNSLIPISLFKFGSYKDSLIQNNNIYIPYSFFSQHFLIFLCQIISDIIRPYSKIYYSYHMCF